ncbi:sphingoid long-chain base transporter Rsb1p [Trichomonascus vanleenenianus]|uniref:phospholipid-translocating ATPase RSB1 n=1 Tax=Trichomonascus vanleenenianus TaxID=2268995 RepID=UPI003ECA3822
MVATQTVASVTLPSGVTSIPASLSSLLATATALPTGSSADNSLYGFVPGKGGNLACLIVFAILWGAHSVLGVLYRQWWFVIAFFIACGLETAGYIARYLSATDPGSINDFLVQIICLTLGPAFLMGGVYYQLAKLVTIYGEQYSILRPMHYSALFITCDLISIVLQAIGGGMAAVAVRQDEDTASGTHIMVAGIAFQVFSMTLFLVCFGWFMWKVYKAYRKSVSGGTGDPFNPKYAHIRRSVWFRLLPYAIVMASLCVYVRCVYRVVELAQGWRGFIITHEIYLFILDALFIALAAFILAVVHPGFALGKEPIPVRGLHKKAEKQSPHS